MRLRPRPLRRPFHQKHPAGRAREETQPCHRWLPCGLTSVSRAKYGSRRRRSPYYFLPYGRARWFFLSPITEEAKAGPRAPALRNAGAALLRRGGGTVGGPSGCRQRTRRLSQPAGSAVALCNLGRVTWLLRRGSSALPECFFTFQEHCKTVEFLFRVTVAVVSCLPGYLLAFFLETPALESSGYVKICLCLKKNVSWPCDCRGNRWICAQGARLPGGVRSARGHLRL